MLCYVIWLFVKRLSQEAIQRRSQRDRLVKIKVLSRFLRTCEACHAWHVLRNLRITEFELAIIKA